MIKISQLKSMVAMLAVTVAVVGGVAAGMVLALQAHAASARSTATSQPARTNQDSAMALQQQGWAMFQQQKFDEAKKLFQKSIDLDATIPNTWNGLAWARMSVGETDGAVSAFEKGLQLDAKNLSALNGLGQIRFMQGRLGQAEQYLLRAAEVSPDAAFALGRLYLVQEKWADAQRWLKKAAANPHGAQYGLMTELQAAARDKKLGENLRRMLSPPAPTPAAKELLSATMLLQRGDSERAKQALDRALEIAPDDPEVLAQAGRFHLNSGDVDQAHLLFQRALRAEPDNAAAMHGTAACLTQRGSPDEALAMWQKVLERYPESMDAAWSVASRFLDRGESDKALPILENLAKEMPENEEVQAALARAREGAKKG